MPEKIDAVYPVESFFAKSPTLIFFFIALTVFTSEAAVMLLLHFLSPETWLIDAFVDATLLVMMISPALYFFLFRPMVAHLCERGRLEEKLNRNAEEQFKDLIRTSLDGFLITDMLGNFIEVNDTYCNMMGYTQEEMLGMNLRALNTPEQNVFLASRMKDLIENGYGSFESAHLCRGGIVMQVEINVRVIESGGRQLLLSVVRDITERKRMEIVLQENEEKFRLMSTYTQDALIMMDDEGNISFWNAAAEKIFGYTENEVMHKELHTFIAPEKYYDAFKKVYGHFRDTGEGGMIGKTRELMAMRKGALNFRSNCHCLL